MSFQLSMFGQFSSVPWGVSLLIAACSAFVSEIPAIAADAIAQPLASSTNSAPTPTTSLTVEDLKPQPVQPAAGMQSITPVNQLSEGKLGSTGQEGFASEATPGMQQVTSVSQFSDVQPTDWAYQALKSLVERYGCIVGYPDKTYRGNRALTRWEFAAGLNACLDKIQELIAAATADFVRKEDLETVKRLQELFAAELASLRGRVDALEVRTATLEKQQFSTTTKLNGEVIFVGGGIFTGDNASGNPADQVITFQNRLRLILSSSFTGKDALRLIFTANNIEQLGFSTNPTTNQFGGVLGTYDGLLADTRAPRYAPNGLYLTTATYRFPLTDTTTLHLFAQSEGVFAIGMSSITNPYFESGGGDHSITRFGRRNAVFDYGDSGPGIALLQRFGRQFELGLAYTVINGDVPTQRAGLIDGRYVFAAQGAFFSPNRNFRIALTYVNAYSPKGLFFGPQIGSNLANSTMNTGAVGNSYGAGAFYQVSPKFAINGWVGYTNTIYLRRGNGDVWNWAVGLAFPDLFRKGSLGGILVGMEPRVTGLDSSVNLGRGFGTADRDTSLHVEAFYQYRINDNIEIAPGALWITAPNSDARNAGVVIGLIRTTFKF